MVEMVKYSATGRRKSSVARVIMTPGTGTIIVNDREFNQYFSRETDRLVILEPLTMTHLLNKFNIDAKINGGGTTGQAGAMRLGISRAIALTDQEALTILKKEKCLRRDPRMKERKKPGQKGARKKFQWVKR